MEIDPSIVPALASLGDDFADRDHMKEAKEMYQRAINSSLKHGDFQVLLLCVLILGSCRLTHNILVLFQSIQGAAALQVKMRTILPRVYRSQVTPILILLLLS